MRRLIVLVFAMLLTAVPLLAQTPTGATVYAITTDNRLISFDSASPGTLLSSTSITGLADGETVQGIDFRPANMQLIALGSSSRLYVLNTANGSATALGGSFSTPLNGGSFGFDFNPTVDRIRLTSDARQDLRLNPNNGAVAAIDGALGFASADRNNTATPNIVASAYTNNFSTATTTTLYNIDATLDLLVTQNPPNAGTLNTIGALGVDATTQTSFDILSDALGSDIGYLSIGANLYLVNLASGGATLIGSIGASVTAIAVAGSTMTTMTVPMCADFNGSLNPVVRAEFPTNVGNIFCRVLAENRALIGQAAAQIGDASVISMGVIQAADIFMPDSMTAPTFASPIKVCLQGSGNFIFLSAQQSPRQPQVLTSMSEGGFTCAFIGSPGTVVLTSN